MNLDFLVRALEKAGGKALESFKVRNDNLVLGIKTAYLEEKSPRELVIREDILCQKIIVEAILSEQPEAVIYSEESENLSDLEMDTAPLKYIIDPLDGTHNFYFGLPYWGISVGVLNQDNRSVGGVIYLPSMGILLKNEGTNLPTMIKLNGGWQKVSTVPRLLSQAMICYDNQFYKLGVNATSIYERLTHEAFTTRITGSAVVDAAFIATGRISARIWNNTLSYDVAAGMAIVLGAGGQVTGFAGEPVNVMVPRVVMSSDDSLHGSLLELIYSK
jgi:myo-inositol-1(or 4)-monophosphatase